MCQQIVKRSDGYVCEATQHRPRVAMILAGGAVAFIVYQWVGLKFLSKGWFNLDVLWASSLVLVGAIGLITAM